MYGDTLDRCWVADEQLTDRQREMIERSRALLQETVEVEDFLTGERRQEVRESRVMKAYKEYATEYENAVVQYAVGLARAQSGTAADLIEWNRSGGILRQRAMRARSDWVGMGYKEDVEEAQATINQILGTSMVQWKNGLQQGVAEITDNTQGVYGYPFFPAGVLPGGFARSDGWTRYSQRELHRHDDVVDDVTTRPRFGRFLARHLHARR